LVCVGDEALPPRTSGRWAEGKIQASRANAASDGEAVVTELQADDRAAVATATFAGGSEASKKIRPAGTRVAEPGANAGLSEPSPGGAKQSEEASVRV